MMRKFLAVAIGLVVGGVVLWFFFPQGCFDADSPPGLALPRGGCPQNDTHIGLLWPNIATGLVFAPLLALLVGGLAGRFAWGRLVSTGSHDRQRPTEEQDS